MVTWHGVGERERCCELHPLGDDLREELAGAADERLALRVLVGPRGLADEDQARVRVADAEDQVPAVGGELAALADDCLAID